ncbi:MAG: glycosyltransferase family 39 protein, partial [Candidatus Omnitrophica bacterium]|nr:glycosyltransferase family 39 protein [Candidatus Omnitrophota bacterium]
MRQRNSYLLIFLAAFLLSLFFIILDKDGSSIKNDATIYLGIAKNVLEGHGYSDRTIAPYLPTMSREPVYPLFLSFLLFILKNNIFLIQVAQAVIYGFTCLIIFKILTLIISDERTAFKIAMINALFPALPNYTAYLIAETLFACLLALTALFLVKAFKKDGLKDYLFSGIFLGLATLTRAVVVLFFAFVILIIFLESLRKYKRIFVSLILKQTLLFLFGFLIIVLPWMMR